MNEMTLHCGFSYNNFESFEAFDDPEPVTLWHNEEFRRFTLGRRIKMKREYWKSSIKIFLLNSYLMFLLWRKKNLKRPLIKRQRMPAKRFSRFSFLLVCGVKDNKKTRSHQRGCIVNCFIFPKEEMLHYLIVGNHYCYCYNCHG